MLLLNKIEKRFGRYVPENLTKILLAGQVISFIMIYSRPDFAEYFYLTGKQVISGEVWRLALLLFTPVSGNFIFAALALYFFYIFSTILENSWGSFRYLVYVLIAYAATVIYSFIFPNIAVTSAYIYTSLFLAFTYLHPDFRVLLFFVVPVKVKWLGYFAWAALLSTFLFDSIAIKILILFSISNFVIFFYKDLIFGLKTAVRGKSTLKRVNAGKPLHVCAVCGQNEIDNPHMEIRYCSQCVPTTCYCGEHVTHHQHKRSVN